MAPAAYTPQFAPVEAPPMYIQPTGSPIPVQQPYPQPMATVVPAPVAVGAPVFQNKVVYVLFEIVVHP